MDSPFVLCKIRQPVSLLPCHIGDARLGIDQEMTTLLMRYSDKLEGVILSFSNVRLEKPSGHILNEQPFIHCKVIADALVFQPRVGMTLSGVVNKIGSNHIGLLIAGVFNGSVAANELPKGYVHNYAEDAWKGADGTCISVGETITVKVVRVHVAGGMIAIEASMRSGKASSKPSTKATRKEKASEPTKAPKAAKTAAKKQQSEEPVAEKKPKKSAKSKPQAETDEVTPVVKSKKRKQEKATEPAPVAIEEDKPKKKKSKKSKKEE
ncbi:hypothetical protein P43SY_007028 [Pythium insidiosum]|uniref:DNA-directed RNA polymerase I subunit RPA43 n=1 Tax=Pythium insidiosum TaxID=114742 RepID=A0AAD5M914_PYTIN|nr:hypothetical protein P43SY_007028 [Pythium insidiosum]